MEPIVDSQRMLFAAIEGSQDCVKLIGCDGRILYMNGAGCALMELDGVDAVINRSWAEFWPESARPRVLASIASGIAKQPDRFDAVCPTSKGRTKHWDVVVTPLLDNDGAVQGLLATSRDVSELVSARREADARERALERQAAALRSAGRVAKIGGWEIDLRTTEVHWSEEVWELLRGAPRPILLAEAMEIYPEPERPRILALLEHAALTGERVTFEATVQRFDGNSAPIRVFGEPVLEDGVCVALRGAAQDVTESRQAQISLEGAERRLRVAVEMSDILVYEVDYERREVFRDGAEHLFFERGLTFQEMLRDPFASVDARDRELTRRTWEEAERTGSAHRAEYRVARADGSEVWAFSTCRLERDAAGCPLRLVGALQDITWRKEAENALIAARDQADAANAAKSAFLANVSHEIRTPLNGILGMAQVMARSDLPVEAKSKLEVIRRSGETLMATLNDVLDLSKVEAGHLELESVEFELHDCVRTACIPFELGALQKDLTFKWQVEPDAEGVYLGDPFRIRQVLANLTSNALKFTDRGGITVRVTTAEEQGLRFEVHDTGIGIPLSQQARLFEKFSQGDASTTRRYGGTGLGLAICRELVELMGGQLEVSSEPGAGSMFAFEVLLERAEPTFPGETRSIEGEAERQRPIRILAAEDNPTNRLVLQALLEPLAVDLVQVESGEEAVALLACSDFDLVLMDIQMPGMSGVEATVEIRALERRHARPRIPILALTANVMAHQVEEYRRVGMDGCVAKPVQMERLYEAIAEALSGEAQAETRSPSSLVG